MYGTKEFSAIINPPQAGILAVGAARRAPVVEGDQLAVGTVMTVTLSADHRVLDGAVGGAAAGGDRGADREPAAHARLSAGRYEAAGFGYCQISS